jgi:FKBP-type peptidyl-prolyl cis-trans isomerase
MPGMSTQLLLVALLPAALALAGCSKKPSASQTPPGATAQQTPPAVQPEPAAKPTAGKPSKESPEIQAARTLGTKSEKPVQKLPGGLQYIDVKAGSGAAAKTGQTVTVNYTGWLVNGTQFDSSIGRAPFVFPLGAGQVIQAWDEGIVGMKPGGVRKLIVPAALGYRDRGTPDGTIPPNATLIFEVSFLSAQ